VGRASHCRLVASLVAAAFPLIAGCSGLIGVPSVPYVADASADASELGDVEVGEAGTADSEIEDSGATTVDSGSPGTPDSSDGG
jgi:hypothetical protein